MSFFDSVLFFQIAERVKLSKTRSESSSSDRPVLGSEISSIGVSVREKPGKRVPSRATQMAELPSLTSCEHVNYKINHTPFPSKGSD